MRASRTLRARARRPASEAGIAALTRFAVAGARGDAPAVRRAVRSARRAGVARRAAEETALMLVLYAGYPAALETLRVLNDAWPGRARRTREGGVALWRRRGTALSRRIYGPVHRRLLDAVRSLHPDLAAWMVENGYGRVLARRGLGVGARERITIAVLAATRRRRQLVSHLLGAARVGVAPAAIRRSLVIGSGAQSPAARGFELAHEAWQAAFPAGGRRRGRPGPGR